jgi:hypothetical protein
MDSKRCNKENKCGTLNNHKIATIFKQGILEQNITAAVNGKQNNGLNSKEKIENKLCQLKSLMIKTAEQTLLY